MNLRRFGLVYILCFFTFWVGAQNQNNETLRKPIALDSRALSGLDLKKVTNKEDPDRILHQKKLLWGDDLAVFVVSSETKMARWDSYGIEEFIYVISGRARLNPEGAEERFYSPGDFFVAPIGYRGEWETQAAGSHYLELSVIATKRPEIEIDRSKIIPYSLSDEDLSGVTIPKNLQEGNDHRLDLFQGEQLSMSLIAEKPSEREIDITIVDQLIYIIAGGLSLQDAAGNHYAYYTGDFVLIPNGFKGKWSSEGHDIFRYLKVKRTVK